MKLNTLSASLLGLLLASPGLAAQNTSGPAVSEPQGYSQRGQLVHDLVKKWGSHVQETYSMKVRSWTREMAPVFAGSRLDQLQKAANARTFESMNNALLGVQPGATALSITPATLGSTFDDLVFTPVAPCRLFDTRVALGKFGPAQTRSYDVTSAGGYTAQGGSATNCNVGNQGDFKAAVISFTAVNPERNSYLTAYQFNTTRPFAGSLTYQVGGLITNTVVVPLDQTTATPEMSVYNHGRSHVVGDIVGYFDAPEATALDCTSTFVEFPVAAGATFNTAIPACPAGYSMTGAGCRSPSAAGASWAINGVFQFSSGSAQSAFCSGTNNGGAVNMQGSRTCCRVPGK